MFPNIGEVSLYKRYYGAKQHTPLWALELCALSVPQIACMSLSAVERLTLVHVVMGEDSPWSGWLQAVSRVLNSGLLVGGSMSWHNHYVTWNIPELVLAHGWQGWVPVLLTVWPGRN